MARINPLLPQTAVLLAEKLQHQCWVPVDERQKVGTTEAEQRNRCHSRGITAVTLGGIHKILIEKQFTATKPNAVQPTTAQFHPSTFNHMNELHRLPYPEDGYACRQRQAIYLRLFLDEFQRSQRS